jgi:alpha,alpha-trehalase
MYGYCIDMGWLAERVGRVEEVPRWSTRALGIKQRMNAVLWSDSAKNGAGFLDFNIRTNSQVDYVYATDFYPLTFGLATPEQATNIVHRSFSKLFTPRGLLTSSNSSGHQWDKPYGWMPLQMLAVEGLLRYNFTSEACAIIDANLEYLVESGGKSDEKRNLVDANPKHVKLVSGYEENVPMIGFSTGSFLWLIKKKGLLCRKG